MAVQFIPSNPDWPNDGSIPDEADTLPKNLKPSSCPPAAFEDDEQTIVTKGPPDFSSPPPPGVVVADVFAAAPPLRAKLDSATD